MKKLILLLVCSISYAQPYLQLSGDVRNGIVGSEPTNNKPELDALFRFGAVGNKGLKIGGVIESFKAIDFNKYGFEIGYVFKGDILELHTTVEAGWIERYKMNYWCVGLNVDGIYWLSDNIGVSATCNILSRTDLDAMYGGKNWKFSNYIGIYYKF